MHQMHVNGLPAHTHSSFLSVSFSVSQTTQTTSSLTSDWGPVKFPLSVKTLSFALHACTVWLTTSTSSGPSGSKSGAEVSVVRQPEGKHVYLILWLWFGSGWRSLGGGKERFDVENIEYWSRLWEMKIKGGNPINSSVLVNPGSMYLLDSSASQRQAGRKCQKRCSLQCIFVLNFLWPVASGWVTEIKDGKWLRLEDRAEVQWKDWVKLEV